MSGYEFEPWWQRAACAGRDPAWWSSEERPQWPSAVRLCLSCPVRDSCLDEAVRQRDNGVIRGGMLLVDTSRGYSMVPLICANCGRRPVRVTESGGVPRYCGRTCQVASHRRAAVSRRAELADLADLRQSAELTPVGSGPAAGVAAEFPAADFPAAELTAVAA